MEVLHPNHIVKSLTRAITEELYDKCEYNCRSTNATFGCHTQREILKSRLVKCLHAQPNSLEKKEYLSSVKMYFAIYLFESDVYIGQLVEKDRKRKGKTGRIITQKMWN